MRIAICISGVSYNNDGINRYRNYEDAVDSFNENVIDYLTKQGHDVFTFLYTYQTIKTNDILGAYNNFTEAKFIDEHNQYIPQGQTTQAINLIRSLDMVKDLDFDFVLRARFDQKFLTNPFTTYNWDFDKVNFLWREPEQHSLPLVNDTFFGWPHKWTNDIIDSIIDCELNPYKGVKIAIHNLNQPILGRIGKDNIKLLDDRFVTREMNTLYKLTRHE